MAPDVWPRLAVSKGRVSGKLTAEMLSISAFPVKAEEARDFESTPESLSIRK